MRITSFGSQLAIANVTVELEKLTAAASVY